MKIFTFLFLIISLINIASAQDELRDQKKITLKDGSQLIGRIIEEDSQMIRFRTTGGIEMEIDKNQIEKTEDIEVQVEADMVPGRRGYQVGDHELLIMPTAYTMEQGQSYFSSYELVFLNYSYAPSNSTHIGAFTLFPIYSDFLETLTFGVKQKYVNENTFKAAGWITYTPKPSVITIGTVFSIGDGPDGLHLGIATANSLEREDADKDKWEWFYMAGYRLDVSQKIALIAEYTNSSSGTEGGFNGLISIGVRFRGENNTWDLAGVRPLESTEDFLLAPLLKATFLF